ncbi:hypothetical protein ERJ75_001428400 [Trypanosoma vivax]|nr:hypothetical protein ERJ75_001428400 [Trypanosoma vivax]
MFLGPSGGSGGKSHKADAANDAAEPDLVCNAMGSERGRVAVRLAWVTAGRCDEIALLRKKELIGHPGDRNALVVDWGALPKHSRQASAEHALRGDRGRGCAAMGRLIAKTVAWERLAALGARALEKALRPCAATAYSTKRTRRCTRPRRRSNAIWAESSDAAGEARGPTRAAMRHRAVPGTLGRRFEQLREVDGLMRRARRAWSNCLVRPQGPRAKEGANAAF